MLSCLVSNPPNDLDIIEVAGKLGVKLGNTMRWEEFGMKLFNINSNEDVKSIDPDNKLSLTEKCKGLLNFWKDSIEDPRWEKVIVVLKDMRLRDLVTKLEKALGTTDIKGMLPYVLHHIPCLTPMHMIIWRYISYCTLMCVI